jgi:hypothetical protein
MTRDVDVVVSVADDAGAESVVFELLQRGYTVASVLEQSAADRLATIRLLPPGQDSAGAVLDLLFASSGIEDHVANAAEEIQILTNTTARVATVGHLIALKLLSAGEHRPQDGVDLSGLVNVAQAADLELARDAVRAISTRGYSRGRDLEASLDALLQRLQPQA